jgi:hypothetical protein
VKTAILLPGTTPRWIDHHARHLAEQLAGLGRVLVVSPTAPSTEWVLPGEVGQGSVLGNSVDGYPLWTGGLTAAVGLRRRQDAVVIVLWEGASMWLALASSLVARLRRERVVLDLEYAPGHRSTGATALGERILARLAASIVRLDPGRVDGDADAAGERVVVAVCGRDEAFARTVHTAFTGLADAAVVDWRIRLHVDPDTLPWIIADDRHRDRITVHSGPIEDPLPSDASVVMVPHGAESTYLVERAVARGAAGVIVGHPVAGRVARRGDGVWLAAHDPSSILVAMESSTGASRERAPVAKANRSITGDAVVASVARLAEPVGA